MPASLATFNKVWIEGNACHPASPQLLGQVLIASNSGSGLSPNTHRYRSMRSKAGRSPKPISRCRLMARCARSCSVRKLSHTRAGIECLLSSDVRPSAPGQLLADDDGAGNHRLEVAHGPGPGAPTKARVGVDVDFLGGRVAQDGAQTLGDIVGGFGME